MAELHRHTIGNTRIIEVDASPNGSITAPKGTIALDSTNGTAYVNTDAGTTWVELKRVQATESLAGIAEIATQAEVDAGSDNTRFVTPSKLAAWIGLGGTKFKAFSLNGVGSSFSTGALGFTPTHAIAFVQWLGTSNQGSIGLATGTATNDQAGFQLLNGAAVNLDAGNIINGSSDYNCSAFSSSGITLNRNAGTSTITDGILLVFGAN